MLEQKFAIYYRAARLPSQASYSVLAEESQAFFKHSPHTNSTSNSVILHNNHISLLSLHTESTDSMMFSQTHQPPSVRDPRSWESGTIVAILGDVPGRWKLGAGPRRILTR